MSPLIRFTVLGKPETAGSKRAFVNKNTGRAIVTDDNRHTKNWQAQVRSRAREAFVGEGLIQGPVWAHFSFYFARPKSHYTSRGELRSAAPRDHTQKPDTLKLARAIEDALTGVLYRDDAQIVSEDIEKHWTDGAARAEIIVEEIAT